MANYYMDENGNISTKKKKKKKGTNYYMDENGNITKSSDDDIAPVAQAKGGNKDSWFKSGGFSDGVDGVGDFFGDLGETVAGTVGDAALGIAKGAGRLVEGLVDLGTYGVAGMADLFGDDDLAEDIRKVARYSATDEWTKGATNFVDQYSVLGNKADAVTEGLGQVGAIILTGGAAAGAGLGSAGVAALTTGVTGLSSMGTNMGEAYDSGATDEDAFLYGLTTGAIEAGTELLFGGLGKGVKALGISRGIGGLDDIFAKKLSSKVVKAITNESVQKALGNTVEYAVKAGGEGFEEVLSGLGSAVMKKLTYMEDEELSKLVKDENLLESFVVGTITSSIVQGGDLVKATKSGTDFVTGHTVADEKVINKVVEDEIAKREANGTKLSEKEKNKIYDSVVDQMEKGQIDIDTIESVLGGDTYKAYTDQVNTEEKLKKELEDLSNIKAGELTRNQQKRLEELEGMNLDNTARRDGLRKKLDETVSAMLKDSKLAESYRERERRGQAFEADLSKYTGKQREAVERAVKSGVLNNTYRSHELVDILSKIEADKGIAFDYTNNAKLKESGFAIEGKTVNGFANKGKGAVTLNVQSSKAWQSTVGHEITHILEGTDAYDTLRTALYEYAESKGELESRRAYLTELYQNMDADIESELTADLVGDYLFTDKAFINKLTGNRTVFQKIYDEIKYLYSVATGKEKTEIEKVKDEFDKAWEQLKVDGKGTDEKVQYSLIGETKDGRRCYESGFGEEVSMDERIDIFKERIATIFNLGAVELKTDVKKIQVRGDKFTVKENLYGDMMGQDSEKEAKVNSLYDLADILATSEYDPSETNKEPSYENPSVQPKNPAHKGVKYWYKFKNEIVFDGVPYTVTFNIRDKGGEQYQYLIDFKENKTPGLSTTAVKSLLQADRASYGNSIAPLPKNVNTQFSLSPETDADYMSAVERGDTETAQRMVDEAAKANDYTVKAYHGTGRADRVGNVFRADRATSGPMAFFTDNKDIASNYARDKADTSLAYDEEYDSYYTQFRVSRDGKNISIPELWKYLSVAERNKIKELAGHIKFDDDYETIIFDESAQHGNGAWDAYTLNMHRGNALEALVDTWLETGDLYNQEELFLEVLKKVGITDAEYRNPDARYEKVYDTWLKITNPFDTDNADQSFYDNLSEWINNNDMSVYEKETANADMWDKNNQTPESWLGKLEYDIENGTTHAWTVIPDFVTDYLKSQGFDGIKDKGGKGGGEGHTVWIPFSSEQVKSAEAIARDDNGNVIPLSQRFDSSKNDIRYSLSKEGEEYAPVGDFAVYGKDIAYTPLGEDIAPVAENVAPTTETPKPNVVRPMTEEEANAIQDEKVNAHSATMLEAIQMELENDKELRSEAYASFERKIAQKQAELKAKKNTDTKTANNLRMQIERLKRLRDSTDADYAKRISTLETREKLVREGKPTTRQELHNNIINDLKATFSSSGYELDDVLDKAKDLSTFSTVDNTPQRVMEKALGYKEGQILADLTVNKVAQNETEGIKWLNSYLGKKEGEVVKISKQYGIKPGSDESAAAQMYAEGFYVTENNDIVEYGEAELAQDFPNANTRERIKALARDPRIRQIYDETLDLINESRKRNAYPEIQRLDNYYLHMRAMNDTWSKIGLPFNPNDIRAKDLPTDLNGVTADLKPGQPYFSSAMHRKGKRTSFDLLGGLERYLTAAKNQIYHIDDIQTLRALRNYIADTYGQANGLEGIDALSEEDAQERIEQVYGAHLSTFAKFLNEEANILAGKTALIDRGLEGIIGRRGMTFLDTVNKQVGSNMVGFNISSSLTNFLPVAQTIAKTNKFDFLKAFAQTVSNKFGSIAGKSDGFAENSPVIIRRKGADKFYRTPFQKAGDVGYVLMSAVDDISTELIARTKFNELTRKGMDEQQAHFETDKWVSRIMGDRSLGQQPQLYNSKTLGVLTKFQLEVRNQLDSQFYDTIQEAKVSNEDIENGLARNAKTAAKVTSTFVQLAVAQHLFGKAFEAVAGYNPAFDIISTLATMFGWDDDEESEDTVLDNVEQGFLELLEDLPYTSTFTGGRIPIASALPITELIKGVDSYGNEKSRLETLGEAAPYYVLPGGYGQIKKTAAGLGMFSDEHPISGSYTDSGKLRFPVEDTPLNRAQAAIFGQYASKNAREYFDNDYAPLSEKQIQEFIDVDIPIKDYRDYREGLKKQETLEDKFDYISGLDLPISKKNILINNVVDRKEPVDLENYEDFGSLEEFDFATKNPEKYAFAKSVGGYSAYKTYSSELYDIKADKDANGKSINGSRKEKVINYINNLDADYYAKIILYKSEYPSDDSYNQDIVNYIANRADLSYTDKVTILTELGFRVAADGQIYDAN